MRVSLRMLIALVAGLSVVLALLVIASPAAKQVTEILLVVLLLTSTSLAIATLEPQKSFWTVLAINTLAVNLWLRTDVPVFEDLRDYVKQDVVSPSYDLIHDRDRESLDRQFIRIGDGLLESKADGIGGWQPTRMRRLSEADDLGVDIDSIPFVADRGDFRLIALDVISISMGLLMGWLAYTIRRWQTASPGHASPP